MYHLNMVNKQGEATMREFNALEKQFMVEIEAKYPGFYDFKQGPTGSFWLPDTCSAYAGYELALELHGVKEHFVLNFYETRVFCSAAEYDPMDYREEYHTFQVSTRKLETWIKTHEHEYNYVKAIIEAGLNATKVGINASPKYSFGDTPDWWVELQPDGPEMLTDTIKNVKYLVVCS
jgi:hypothetical protein